MRIWIYHLLVNRVLGIRERFLEKKQRQQGGRLYMLGYLLWLNFSYYALRQKALAQSVRFPVYEQKKLPPGSESAQTQRKSPEEFVELLAAYDVISFDVFDTLVLRPFSEPADLFYVVGMELGYPDFKQRRIETEMRARRKKRASAGKRQTHTAHGGEVTLEEIWRQMERDTGIPAEKGMQSEWQTELRCCSANPYFLRVTELLRAQKKTIIAVSDMYLGEERIKMLLEKCGFGAFDACVVSCDHGKSKSDGSLYDTVRDSIGWERSIVHVGDNEISDVRQAQKHGIAAYHYKNIHDCGKPYRAFDLSALTGSVYRAVVNAELHADHRNFSKEYEYGFVYGGLFAVGYCRFIHAYAQRRHVEKLLFLARDGAVLQQVYCALYPREAGRTVYAYWSRQAALKLTAEYFRYDYFARFLFHKADQKYTLRKIFAAMELSPLLPELCRTLKISPQTELTNRNAKIVRKYLLKRWREVLAVYEPQRAAAEKYFGKILHGCSRAAAVDIGWAGSGAWMLDCAVNRIWKLGCEITGILAGTEGALWQQGGAAEAYLTSGKLASYLYSPFENRELWKFHDPSKGHNLYWELLLSAPQGSLKGFYPGENGGVVCRFRKNHTDASRIREIHRGIRAFAQAFGEAQARIGAELPISGRDAYAPMLSVLAEKNRNFCRELKTLLDDIHVG